MLASNENAYRCDFLNGLMRAEPSPRFGVEVCRAVQHSLIYVLEDPGAR